MFLSFIATPAAQLIMEEALHYLLCDVILLQRRLNPYKTPVENAPSQTELNKEILSLLEKLIEIIASKSSH
jgi:hypothetical protein